MIFYPIFLFKRNSLAAATGRGLNLRSSGDPASRSPGHFLASCQISHSVAKVTTFTGGKAGDIIPNASFDFCIPRVNASLVRCCSDVRHVDAEGKHDNTLLSRQGRKYDTILIALPIVNIAITILIQSDDVIGDLKPAASLNRHKFTYIKQSWNDLMQVYDWRLKTLQ
ncbi:hypothetical protein NPIL_141691 [Nephila pilipes]|uniref:Uncharacterized protein n=1 Tax=Nephila pilipes TaxID=299642 RepID=A0A8X6IGE9_NEPPI|nr:hypothetical protein NPIL_141691 [Nephila pilipes]